jgi:hypothetical protein
MAKKMGKPIYVYTCRCHLYKDAQVRVHEAQHRDWLTVSLFGRTYFSNLPRQRDGIVQRWPYPQTDSIKCPKRESLAASKNETCAAKSTLRFRTHMLRSIMIFR